MYVYHINPDISYVRSLDKKSIFKSTQLVLLKNNLLLCMQSQIYFYET